MRVFWILGYDICVGGCNIVYEMATLMPLLQITMKRQYCILLVEKII